MQSRQIHRECNFQASETITRNPTTPTSNTHTVVVVNQKSFRQASPFASTEFQLYNFCRLMPFLVLSILQFLLSVPRLGFRIIKSSRRALKVFSNLAFSSENVRPRLRLHHQAHSFVMPRQNKRQRPRKSRRGLSSKRIVHRGTLS